MKQIIYSTGVFETELTVTPPAPDPGYDAPFKAIIRQPQYELRKTSYCKSKFIIEIGDKDFLLQLSNKADKAIMNLRDGLISQFECQNICKRYDCFSSMYHKALDNTPEICENIRYIELADETCRGCRAIFQLNDGVIEQTIPCRVGDILEIKFDPTHFQFLPMKAVANYVEQIST